MKHRISLDQVLKWYKFNREVDSSCRGKIIAPLKEAIHMARYEVLERIVDEVIRSDDKKDQYRGYDVLAHQEQGGKKVLVMLKEGEPQKYILARSASGKEYIVTVPGCSMHYQIKGKLEEALEEKVSCIGGGWMRYEKGKLVIYGRSIDFGRADHEKVAKAVREAGLEVEVKQEER